MVRILVVVVSVVLLSQLIDDAFSYLVDSDNALYMLLTKALATGQGYVWIHLPGHPHAQYPPPLFPFFLSPLFHLFGYNFTLMRLLIIAFTMGSVFLVAALFKRLEEGEEGEGGEKGAGLTAWMIAMLFITNHGILVFTKELLPEMPYIFFALLALYAAEALKEREDLLPYALYLPVLFAVAYLTKNHGIFLVISMTAVLSLRLLERGGDQGQMALQLGAFTAVTIAPFALWILTKPLLALKSVYIFGILKGFYGMGPWALLARVWDNIVMMVVSVPGALITFVDLQKIMPPTVFNAFSLFLFFTVLAGLVYRLAVKRGVMDFYVACYLFIIVLWPVYGLGDARRYMIPLVPFLYYYSFTGFNLIFSLGAFRKGLGPLGRGLGPGRMKPSYMLIPFAIFLFLNVAEIRGMFNPGAAAARVSYSAVLLQRDLFTRVEELGPEAVVRGVFKGTRSCYNDYILSAYMLKRLSAPDEVIMTRKPELVSLITGAHAVKFPFTEDRGLLSGFIGDNGVDYVLLDGCFPETWKYLLPFVNENIDMFEAWRGDEGDVAILKVKNR